MKHKFVEFIPVEPGEGILYISIEYKTATHLCVCGCKNKVITPITPIDWQLTFNGETVSLNPSIGNWRFPCKSHYYIKQNKIVWADTWSDEKIQDCHDSERISHERYYGEKSERQNKKIEKQDNENTSLLRGLFKKFFS